MDLCRTTDNSTWRSRSSTQRVCGTEQISSTGLTPALKHKVQKCCHEIQFKDFSSSDNRDLFRCDQDSFTSRLNISHCVFHMGSNVTAGLDFIPKTVGDKTEAKTADEDFFFKKNVGLKKRLGNTV